MKDLTRVRHTNTLLCNKIMSRHIEHAIAKHEHGLPI